MTIKQERHLKRAYRLLRKCKDIDNFRDVWRLLFEAEFSTSTVLFEIEDKLEKIERKVEAANDESLWETEEVQDLLDEESQVDDVFQLTHKSWLTCFILFEKRGKPYNYKRIEPEVECAGNVLEIMLGL